MDLSGNTWSIVKLYREEENPDTYAFVKVQCMHCVDPACASACPVGALQKTADGPVVYADSIERREYGAGLAKFDQHPELFEPVFRGGEASVYRVVRSGAGR